MGKYLIQGKKVKHVNGVLKWSVGNWSTDLEKHEQVIAFKDVFRHFEFINYPLRYESTSNIKEAYFKIYFVLESGDIILEGKKKFKCPEKLESDTLAIGYAPYGGVWQGHIFINDSFFWNMKENSESKKLLIPTLIHEVAHCFNLDHIDEDGDLMHSVDANDQKWSDKATVAMNGLYILDRVKAVSDLSTTMFIKTAYEKL